METSAAEVCAPSRSEAPAAPGASAVKGQVPLSQPESHDFQLQ